MIHLFLDPLIFPNRGRYTISGHKSPKTSEYKDGRTGNSKTKGKPTKEGDHVTLVADPDAGKKRRRLILKIGKIIYCIIGAFIMGSGLLLIGLAAFGQIVFRDYDYHEAHRVASMIVVAFTAATGVALAVYGITTAVKNSKRPLHKISISFVILAMIMLVLAVFTIHMSTADEVLVLKAMKHSLKMAQFHSPRNEKQWDNIQNQMDCCGIYGPEDYRREGQPDLTPPEIIASCCVSYDPDQTTSSQHDMKEVCRRQGTYYRAGCREQVIETLMSTSDLVYGMCIIVVVFLLALGLLGILLANLMMKWWKDIVEVETEKPTKPELIVPTV